MWPTESLTRQWSRLKNYSSTGIGHRLVSSRAEDQYIVSYPRSGSTWLRTILVNLLDPQANSDPDVFNARIPGVSIRNAKRINLLPSPRLIKTHSGFRAGLSRVLYIVRDGRDALSSHYHYATVRQGHQQSLAEFFSDYFSGVHGVTWDEHVSGWLTQGREALGDNLRLIRFESLKADTLNVVEEIVDFLNLNVSQQQIQDAVGTSDLDTVRRIEKSRTDVDLSNPNASFYRRGASGEADELFDAGLRSIVMQRFSDALELAGYQIENPRFSIVTQDRSTNDEYQTRTAS
jgi:hypothetical protein